MKINDALTGAALVVLAAAILWHVQGFPEMPGQKFGPAWFPGLVAAGLGVCGMLLVASGWRSGAPWLAVPEWIGRPGPRRAVGTALAGLLLYIFVADRLGFHLTALLLLGAWTKVFGASWRLTAAVALLVPFAMHFAFYKLLRVPLPWGVLERWAF